MAQKLILIKVELEIKKLTCPGVWLCSNGKVSLQLYMLDSCVQSESYKPIFPIKFYEKFVFSKSISKSRLNDLQRRLDKEWFYVEFIQWKNGEDGCVLAKFQTTLEELLYPKTKLGVYEGMGLDLLLDTTKLFPGTIAPKLLINTKVIIEENECSNKGNRCESLNMVLSSRQLVKRNLKRDCNSLSYNSNDLLKSRNMEYFEDESLKRSSIRELNKPKTSIGNTSTRNMSPSRFYTDSCKYQIQCPTCRGYRYMFCDEGHKRQMCYWEEPATDNGCCKEINKPFTLVKHLQKRLQDCFCVNANIAKHELNNCIDFN